MTVLGKLVRRLGDTVDVLSAHRRGCEKIDGIEVYGRPEFRCAVTGALLLLRDNTLPSWDTLTRHVGSILEGRRTVAVVTAHPAFVLIDRAYWAQASEFLAAIVAFEACSIQLHRTYEAELSGRRVPRDLYAGSAAFERCEKAYRECLLALRGRR
jgi:hypothetical protein